MAMWDSRDFEVTSGRGGAVSTSGPVSATVSNSVFSTNAAPKAATLSITAASSLRVTNTTIDAPEDESSSSTAVWLV
eukprot:COSAG04_NODE_8131_length_1019_cov_1.168478_1_plen_76_part_10